MTQDEIKLEIKNFLMTSTLSPHEKSMIEILLPGMTEAEASDVYRTLKTEHDKMAMLNEKKKRIELKYKVMVEGLVKAKKG